ncbi:MAG TPA: helix-turn-helix transcriptional regulator [Dehalococcoidia bacterium]|nr:helix-turn-helix transcriptional regulator [Dehalococcoidia bacterium]
MNAVIADGGVGGLLRDWRQRRRLSQLDLAVEAEVSTRHLSFVETGRSRPSRELVLHLAEQLEVPLRERNALLLAAGYAPVYRQSALETVEMTPVREALDKILAGHEPFPAIVVDRHWNLVSANRPSLAIMSSGVAPALLTPPVNVLRATLHPDGLAPQIVNLGEYRSHLLDRLHRQVMLSADAELAALERELRGYPGDEGPAPHGTGTMLFVPLVLRASATSKLTFFSTIATFGTAIEITAAELSIESFFPANHATANALRAAWSA